MLIFMIGIFLSLNWLVSSSLKMKVCTCFIKKTIHVLNLMQTVTVCYLGQLYTGLGMLTYWNNDIVLFDFRWQVDQVGVPMVESLFLPTG